MSFLIHMYVITSMVIAAEVEKETRCEVILGSTHILTPVTFLEDIKKLDPEIKIDLL